MTPSTGRPPTTTEGEVRRIVRRLRGPAGILADADRMQAMTTMLRQIDQGVRYGRPPREQLVHLAAHAQAWAEEIVEVDDDD